jgi:hypothetical protein
MTMEKLYDTREKRIAFLNKEGSIITFKKEGYTVGRNKFQLIIKKLHTHKGKIMVEGLHGYSVCFKDIEALIMAIDWSQMERWHAD